jgi:predicted PurR-regulated permease PerM
LAKKPNSNPSTSPRNAAKDQTGGQTAEQKTNDDVTAMGSERAASSTLSNALAGAQSAPMAKIISVAMLLLAIVVIGILFFQVMASFFVPLFLAALLVVIFRPLFQWILSRVDGRTHVASILTTICILLLVLLPAGTIAFIAAAQGADFFRQINSVGFYQSLDRVRERLSLDLPHAEQFRQLDEDLELMAEPGAIETMTTRLDEAEDIVIFLTDALGRSDATPLAAVEDRPGDDVSRRDGASGAASPAATFREEVRFLRQRAEAFEVVRDSDNAIERQNARDAYQSQFWQVRSAQRDWMRSLIGDSIGSQLKLLANPSDAEFRAILNGAQEYLQPRVLPFTQMAGRFLFQIFVHFGIMVIALYFFFSDGPGMIRTLMRLSPLDDEYEERLLLQFDQTSRAVVLATVLSALAQGVLTTAAFWALDMPSLVLLFLATTFMAFIPFLGPATVWVPVAIYLGAVEGRLTAAAMLVVFGLTVVATIDNLVRMFVLQGNSQLHPLLALLSVLGGLQVFGPIGILVGPMTVVFLQTLLEILNHELGGKPSEAEPQAATVEAT